jgi:hypothetical protein
MFPNITSGGQNSINLTVVNATNFYGNLNASYIQNAPWITTWTPNTTAEMRTAVNNSGFYNITSNNSNYLSGLPFSIFYNASNPSNYISTWTPNTTTEMRNAINNSGYYNITANNSNYAYGKTEGNLNANSSTYWNNINSFSGLNYNVLSYFNNISDIANCTSTQKVLGKVAGAWVCSSDLFNTTNEMFAAVDNNTFYRLNNSIGLQNITNPANCSSGQFVFGKVGSAWVCSADQFNTSAQIWTVIDNNTFHKFSQTITWGNLSSWSLNNVWTGSLGGGNITTGTITSTQIADGTIATADLASGFSINWGNVTGYNLNVAWTGSLGWGNLTGYDLNKAWTNSLGAGNLTAGTLTNASLSSTFKILLGNVTDVANCTAAQKVLGKVGSVWVCDTDLFNSSTEMSNAINATANRYFQLKVNESVFLNGKVDTYYLNTGGFNAGNLTSGTISNIAIVSNQWINTSTGVNASQVYSPVFKFTQDGLHNITWNGTNVIIYG